MLVYISFINRRVQIRCSVSQGEFIDTRYNHSYRSYIFTVALTLLIKRKLDFAPVASHSGFLEFCVEA